MAVKREDLIPEILDLAGIPPISSETQSMDSQTLGDRPPVIRISTPTT
jgi:hypothetical protein